MFYRRLMHRRPQLRTACAGMFMLKMKTQQKRVSQEPQRCSLLLSLRNSDLCASTDEIRHAWLAHMLLGTLNVFATQLQTLPQGGKVPPSGWPGPGSLP
jgi:hypothetical protein